VSCKIRENVVTQQTRHNHGLLRKRPRADQADLDDVRKPPVEEESCRHLAVPRLAGEKRRPYAQWHEDRRHLVHGVLEIVARFEDAVAGHHGPDRGFALRALERLLARRVRLVHPSEKTGVVGFEGAGGWLYPVAAVIGLA